MIQINAILYFVNNFLIQSNSNHARYSFSDALPTNRLNENNMAVRNSWCQKICS